MQGCRTNVPARRSMIWKLSWAGPMKAMPFSNKKRVSRSEVHSSFHVPEISPLSFCDAASTRLFIFSSIFRRSEAVSIPRRVPCRMRRCLL